MFQVPQHDALDRLGRERDRSPPEQASHESKDQPAQAAQMQAPAAAHSTPVELGCE